jgi:4-hydroxyphenylacetate 3-monooxygenase
MCRESLDQGRSHFDHPLGSRFEEMDAVVFFDDVLVPWERVFLLGDVDMCNNHGNATQMNTHTGHQVTTRCVVKAEFILGLAGQMVETLGSEQLDHVQERMGELVCYLEILKACVRASEADAKLNEWGVMCPSAAPLVAGRNLFPRMMYPRMAEIIQILGSSSLMALPSEADFDTALTPEVERYLATDNSSARDRARLFHLAWDVTCSSFGGRQVLYERFFGGDPVRNSISLSHNYDRGPAMARVREFLERPD